MKKSVFPTKRLTEISAQNKTFWVVFTVLLCAYLYNFGFHRLYPFLDIPNHQALATIYSSYGDPDNQLEKYYTFNIFPKPNIFHMVFCGSKLFPNIQLANTVFYFMYVVFFMFGILLLIIRCRGNIWYALLAFILLYNINVGYGFTGFTIAIPVILFLVLFTINYIENKRYLTGCVIAVLMVLLFFMHAMAALFSFMIYISCVLYFFIWKNNRRNIITYLLPCAPAIALFCFWWITDSRDYEGPGLLSSISQYYQTTFFKMFWQRGAIVVHDNFRLLGGTYGYLAAAFFSMFIIVFAVKPLFVKVITLRPLLKSPAVICVLVLLFCSLTCSVLMPVKLPGYSFLYQRFTVFLFTAIILIGSIISPKRISRFSKILMCSTVIIHCALWIQNFNAFNEENKGFDKSFFSSCDRNDIVAALIYDNRFRNVSVYNNFLDYYTAWTKGVSTTRLIDDRSFAVGRKVDKENLPEYIKWVGNDRDNLYDGRYKDVDYIIVRGDLPDGTLKYLKDFIIVEQRGSWKLYSNKKNNSSS